MQPDLGRPHPGVVVGAATCGGLLGAILGLCLVLIRETPIDSGTDPVVFVIENQRIIAAVFLGSAVGWLLGAAVAWRSLTRTSPALTGSGWALRVAALLVAGLAVWLIRHVPAGAPPFGYDTLVYADAKPLVPMIAIDAAIVVGTLLLVSRRRIPVAGTVGAGVLAVAALVAVTAVFASMPIPQRSWLDRWLTTRQAPLGAAANVIEPAPVACPARTPDPFPRDARSFATDTPQIWYWINPYTPRWLPPDAGLVLDRSWPEPTAHAVWTDAACDEIALFESPAAQGIKSERPQAATDWVRAELRWCPPDADPCFEFRAYVTSKGSRIRPKLWILRTVGLSRATAATVARSIPTRNVPYI